MDVHTRTIFLALSFSMGRFTIYHIETIPAQHLIVSLSCVAERKFVIRRLRRGLSRHFNIVQ